MLARTVECHCVRLPGVCRRARLVPSTARDLPRTYATIRLRQGVHPKVVQKRLRHASVGITLDIYSHISPHMQSDAADKIDAGMRKALAR